MQVLHRKGISVLTGLKVSSLTCKCVFYRPELNAKAGLHGIEFCKPWNETCQWIELQELLCLVIMFTPIVMVLKMSEVAIFFVFSADNSKKFVTVWEIYLSAQERYWVIAENGMVNRLWT